LLLLKNRSSLELVAIRVVVDGNEGRDGVVAAGYLLWLIIILLNVVDVGL